MEADWEVALGAGDPVIEIPWQATGGADGLEDSEYSGKRPAQRFIDLRSSLQGVGEIREARENPTLRDALIALNGDRSPYFTAKCDTWARLERFDPLEMNADPQETAAGFGSYIDLLARDASERSSFPLQERWLRTLCVRMRGTALRATRSEFVLRHAQVDGERGFGVTWFLEACAASASVAARRWEEAMPPALALLLDMHLT